MVNRVIIDGMQVINRPVKLIFEPTSAEVRFKKYLKLQIMIFRATLDDKGKRVIKMDKTDPMKFSNPQQKIMFSNSLTLLTTLQYNQQSKHYENKEVDFDMALDIDGTTIHMNKKINLKQFLSYKAKNGTFTMDNPEVVFLFRAEVKLQAGQVEIPTEKNIGPPTQKKIATEKKIKFQDDYFSSACQEEIKENCNVQPQPCIRSEKGRHKTMKIEMPTSNQRQKESQIQSQKEIKLKKYFSQKEPELKSFPAICSLQSEKPQFYSFGSKKKIQEFSVKYSQLTANYREMEKKLKEKDSRIADLIFKMEELENKVEVSVKSEKSTRELIKKQQATKANCQSQITSLKEEIKGYKAQIQRLSKTAVTYQQSSKNIAYGSDLEIKNLRERLKLLEKTHYESQKQAQFYQSNMKDKDDIISDLKGKIYILDKENLQLQSKAKSLEQKLKKVKDEYSSEILQLQQRVGEMKVQNKHLKISTMKDIKDDQGDLRKKVQKLQKQLQRKEELLKKMTQLKKQADSQRNTQNSNLKREIADLKTTIENLQNRPTEQASSSTSIEYRVQMQKMKKELQLCRKNEKGLLIEKSRLESNNVALQDEVVKGKTVIANILNVVQQTGDEKLISQAYNLTG